MKLTNRKEKSAYAMRDILVLLACIAFLLLNLAAIGSAGRRRAKEAVCRSNLRQWGVMFQQFADDNGGYFISCADSNSIPRLTRGIWISYLQKYYKGEPNILCCPEATKLLGSTINHGGPFNAYDPGNDAGTPLIKETSYGANAWIYKPLPSDHIQDRPIDWNWKTPHINNADKIPIFSDTMWRGGGPVSGDPAEMMIGLSYERCSPPSFDGEWSGAQAEMKHFCIDRHNGGVNMLFMDWSVRKVGLKELWKLKWHREFNTDGPWTQAGGVRSIDWPEWMREFKDY